MLPPIFKIHSVARSFIVIFILPLLFTMAVNACAEDKTFLYGDYYYGMTRDEFFKTGAAQCDDYPDGSTICNRQGIEFANFKWTQFFEFDKNGLTCVAFGQPMSWSRAEAAFIWFIQENYVPLKATAGRKSIDFTLFYNKDTKSEYEEEFYPFYNSLPSSDDFHAYFIKKSSLEKYETMDMMPKGIVIASIGATKRQGKMFICFESGRNFRITPIE